MQTVTGQDIPDRLRWKFQRTSAGHSHVDGWADGGGGRRLKGGRRKLEK